MTVLPWPGASAWTAPSSSASATARAPKPASRRWRATRSVKARVARSTAAGTAARPGTGGAVDGVRGVPTAAAPPGQNRIVAERWSSGERSRSPG
jgi:hypothetical protein